jgi:hypothetical protein
LDRLVILTSKNSAHYAHELLVMAQRALLKTHVLIIFK